MSRQSPRKRKRVTYADPPKKNTIKLQSELDLLAMELAEYRAAVDAGDIHPDFLAVAHAMHHNTPWYLRIRTSHSPITPRTLAWATNMRIHAALEYGFYARARFILPNVIISYTSHPIFMLSHRSCPPLAPPVLMQIIDLFLFVKIPSDTQLSRRHIYIRAVCGLNIHIHRATRTSHQITPSLISFTAAVLYMLIFIKHDTAAYNVSDIVPTNQSGHPTWSNPLFVQLLALPEVQPPTHLTWRHDMLYHPVFVQQFFSLFCLGIQRLEDTHHIQYTHRTLVEDIFELMPLAEIYTTVFHFKAFANL